MGLIDAFLGKPKFVGMAETARVINLETEQRSLKRVRNAPAITNTVHRYASISTY